MGNNNIMITTMQLLEPLAVSKGKGTEHTQTVDYQAMKSKAYSF
jgi:hypothetical protein